MSASAPLASQPIVPTVLVLGSGRGERFRASGGRVHKLQALLGGSTVLERTLASVRSSGLPWYLESSGLPGMGDSIAAAVRATAHAQAWLVLPGDLPLVQSATLLAVAQALQTHPVVVPVHAGQRGHPVGFAACCLAGLLALRGDRGAAAVVRQFAACELDTPDPGIGFDIDTLEDLQRAQRWVDAGRECHRGGKAELGEAR